MTTTIPSFATAAALTCTAMISLVPNLILMVFPNYSSTNHHSSLVLNMGQALAAGGLLGDVFMHTLPHSSSVEQAGFYILMGFAAFLVVDVLIRSMGGGHSHVHSHVHGEENSETSNKMNGNHHHHHDDDEAPSHSIWLSSTVLLNLGADALHNFTDGVAIGASFAMGGAEETSTSFASLLYSRGGLVALSILFHEVPHELGDYCVLVSQGLSKRQAIGAQFGTAIAAIMGTFAGIWGASQIGDELVFMTAGGFVYLAAVNILPDVLEEISHGSLRFKLAQLCAFAMGIAFMLIVSMMEEHDHSHGGGHDHAHQHEHHIIKEEVHRHHIIQEEHHHHGHGHHHEL